MPCFVRIDDPRFLCSERARAVDGVAEDHVPARGIGGVVRAVHGDGRSLRSRRFNTQKIDVNRRGNRTVECKCGRCTGRRRERCRIVVLVRRASRRPAALVDDARRRVVDDGDVVAGHAGCAQWLVTVRSL